MGFCQLVLVLLSASSVKSVLVPSTTYTAAEFYAGIGGMRCALNMARPEWKVSASYEINTQANAVYEHNWGKHNSFCRSIETLQANELDSMNRADLWLLSPPCQPYTKIGKRLDDKDNRAKSFLYLLDVLSHLQSPPEFLFLENVPGFLGSRSRARMLETLATAQYETFETLLSPQRGFGLGIPNTRLRYFCLAQKKRPGDRTGKLFVGKDPSLFLMARGDLPAEGTTRLRPLSEFLLRKEDLDTATESLVQGPLAVSPELMRKFSYVKFDVAPPLATETSTVTKGYTKQIGKSGPLLCVKSWRNSLEEKPTFIGEKLDYPPSLERFRHLDPGNDEVRFLSPRELLRLHGFPEEFDFPSHITPRQASALIGNSVTVPLLARLLDLLLPK